MHALSAGQRYIEVFTDNGWLCATYPQDELIREQADAIIQARRDATRRDA